MIVPPRAAWIAGAAGSALLLLAAGLAVAPGVAAEVGLSPAGAVLWVFDGGAALWAGVLVAARRPGNAVGPVLVAGGLFVTLLELLSFAAGAMALDPRLAAAAAWPLVAAQLAWPPAYVCIYCLLPLLFPDGRFLSGRWRRFGLALIGLGLLPALIVPFDTTLSVGFGPHALPNPVGLIPDEVLGRVRAVWLVLFSAGAAGAAGSLLVRYRRSDAEERQRMRWVAAAVALTLAALAEQQVAQVAAPGLALPFPAMLLAAGTIPIAIGVAVLRHRLFDIDLVIRRSFVYGMLWLVIVAVYAGLAAGFGLAAGQRLPVPAAVLVTIAATLVFQPARGLLERLADQVAYGRRASAYELLRDFGAATERTMDVAEIGPRLAEAARTGIGARWARVLARGTSADGDVVLGSNGQVEGPAVLTAPLARRELQGEGSGSVQWIECGPRMDGAYRPRDRELLETLGRQAALAIQNAGLLSELAARVGAMDRQARELAASRNRIVRAQQEERRRIERDLHDGIQQQLISLVAGVRLARNRLGADPSTADAVLGDVQGQALQAHRELRELVRGIHPTVLVDAGLARAVEAAAAHLPLRVEIDVDPATAAERFRAEVESTAYFVVCEALANAVKHARVAAAQVAIRRGDGVLLVSVSDRGRGFSPAAVTGSGLIGLEDRVAAVGGSLRIDSSPGAGTTVVARLSVTGNG